MDFDKIKLGDKISFYVSCNADRKKFIGIVSIDNGFLGLVCIINDVKYELRKLVDIQIIF